MLCLRPDIVPLYSQTKSSPTPKGILQGVFADHLKVPPFAKLIIGKVKFFSTRSPSNWDGFTQIYNRGA